MSFLAEIDLLRHRFLEESRDNIYAVYSAALLTDMTVIAICKNYLRALHFVKHHLYSTLYLDRARMHLRLITVKITLKESTTPLDADNKFACGAKIRVYRYPACYKKTPECKHQFCAPHVEARS
jgi:hypothetical protein